MARKQRVSPEGTAVERSRKSEQKISSILAGITDCHYELDCDWRFIRINDHSLAYFGKKREDLIGHSYWEVFPTLKDSIFKDKFNEVVSKSTSVHFDVESVLYPGKWVEVHAYPTEEGGISVFFRDVTGHKRAEEALANTRTLLGTLLTSAPFGFAYFDRELRYVLINEKLAQINGIPTADHIGKRVQDIVPRLAPDALRVTSQILATGQPVQHHEFSGETPSVPGVMRYWNESWYPVRDGAGEIVGFGAFVEEITDRKLAEERLTRSEGRYRELVQNANSVILRWRRDGTLTFINEYGQTLFGYTYKELVGKPVSILLPEQESTGSDLTTLVRDVVDHPERYVNNVNENVCKDGRRVWMSWTNKPIFGEDGAVTEILAVGSDVTDRIHAEEALKKSEMRLTEAQRIAHLGSWDWDIVAEDLVWSDEVYRIFGVARKDFPVTYQSYLACVHPDDRKAVEEAVLASLADPLEKYDIEYRVVLPDASECVVHSRGKVTWGAEDEPIHMIGTVLDITERKRAEEELRLAHDELEFRIQERTGQLRRQADLLDLAHDAVILSNKEGTISFWNKGAEETYGFTRKEAVGKSLHALLQTKSDIPLKDIKGSVENEGRWEGELVHTRKDGKKVTVHSKWALRHDEGGGSTEIMEVNRDITLRKRTEETLRILSAYNRSLIEASVDPLITINLQGMISDVNTATEQVTGYPRDKLVGTDFCDYFVDPAKAKAGYEQVFKEGTVRDFELEILHKDGHITPVLYNASAYKDETGQVIGVFAAARDISERKRVELALKESEERYRTAIESASDGVALMRGDQHIYVNKRFAEMFDYNDPNEILGKPHSLTVHPDDLAMVSEINRKRQMGEQVPSRYEFRGIRKDGSQRNIEVSATMINYRGEPASLVYLRDITEYKDLEQQLRQAQKMEAIGTLAGGIAHDFNNILAAIIGFTEMVEEDLPPGSSSIPRIQRVLNAASRGKELVRQILAFSRKTELERKPLSLSSVIHETFQLLRASLPATIEMNLSAKATRDAILASPAEVQQIIMNLATNAFFAMREKGGVLSISTTDIDFEPDSPVLDEDVEPGEYVQLVVADTGHGMEHQVMQRVFEPFFTTKEVGEGTGMGLAVVYGIVKSLHGTITIESEPGKGSTFRICLPVAQINENQESIDVKATPRGTEHILFIDDEELLVEWAQAALERLGYTVTALTGSMEALKLFSVDPSRFDLVITDQTMPKITGLHLARKLLEIRANIPIILCTGHSDSVSPQKAREAGIRDFLMKPLGKQQLAEAIRRVLNTTESEN